MRAKVVDQVRPIDPTRLGSAERVDVEFHALDTETAPQPCRHGNELDVGIGTGKADGLDVDLVELPVTPFLRLFVPEHRADGPQLVARTAQQAVGNHCAHHTGGRLRTQRQTLATLVGEGVHLLLDNVGELTDRALEKRGVLDDGCTNLREAILREQLAHGVFEMLPSADLLRQHIIHATDRLYLLCQLNCPR